jgi:chaperonin cofactor prefoldin
MNDNSTQLKTLHLDKKKIEKEIQTLKKKQDKIQQQIEKMSQTIQQTNHVIKCRNCQIMKQMKSRDIDNMQKS